MLEALLFGLIGLLWMVTGLVMLANPAWWSGRVRRWIGEPLPCFVLIQGMLLSGLILMVGKAAYQDARLWVILGALLAVLALGLIGMPPSVRGRLLDRWARSPLWATRLTGMVLAFLATLLISHAWRGGP
ncbi:MAG TPA: hypothetical protein VGQ60_00090 [Nitrospiraceae bacterium]|jgi:hypothetical protein|nr:hypothetical protein [Nitrospiraceae bacterium]